MGHQLLLADRVKVQTSHSVSTDMETAAGRGSTCLHPPLLPDGGRGAADVLTPHELSADATSDKEESVSPAACLVVAVKGSDFHLVPRSSSGLGGWRVSARAVHYHCLDSDTMC